MHDLHEADKILKTVLEYAQKNKLRKVTKIDLELGSLLEHGEEISPENLEFNLKLLAKDTIAKDAVINISRTSENYWKLLSIDGE